MAETLKLWLVSQDANNDYDTYDSAVVVAVNEVAARHVPVGSPGGSWVAPELVAAKLIGEADNGVSDGEIVCASFNAG